MLMPIITRERFKKFIIIFWMLWWLIALWTDVVGLLAHNGLLQKSWAPDTNYPFLVDSLKIYNAQEWIAQFLFGGIILWLLLSTLAFCWASASLAQEKEKWMRRADIAFTISLSLWFAFFIGDQLIMKFSLEENHMVQAGFQLLTYLALYLIPSD